MGVLRRNGLFFKDINPIFACWFLEEEICGEDHPAFCGKFIPQSGKDLPTFGIFPEQKPRGLDVGND
jgi:hypothetical protein